MVIQTRSVYDTVSSRVQGDKSRPVDVSLPLSLPSPRVNTLEDDPSIGVEIVPPISDARYFRR